MEETNKLKEMFEDNNNEIEGTERKAYVKVTRKFHDAWAFILYFILTVSINTYCLIRITSVTKILQKIDLKNFFGSVIYALFYIYLVGISLMLFPAKMMHIGFIVFPFINIFIAFNYPFYKLIVTCLVLAIATIIAYFFRYRKIIKFTAKIVEKSVGIFLKHSLFLFLGFITLSVLLKLQYSLLFYIFQEGNFNRNILMLPPCLLHLYWTYFVMVYGMRVLVSSLVSIDILMKSEDKDVLKESLKNTFMSMGSVCLGSLLNALISVVKILSDRVDSKRDSPLVKLFFLIVFIIAKILQAVVEFVNEFTFPYMALYGKSYVGSVKGGFEIVSRQENLILANSLCILPITMIYSLFGYIGYYYIFVFFLDNRKVSKSGMESGTFLTFFLLINVFIRLYESSAVAFLFTNDYDSVAVAEKCPEAANAMKDQIIKEQKI